MVDLLWHQWSAIGVAGYTRPGENRIIDPEALILATTRYGRHDSRLMDESIDWLAQFGNRIHLQRLQGLNKNWPGVADARVLAAIADVLGQQVAHRKWRVLAKLPAESSGQEAFFLGHDGEPTRFSGLAEPFFAQYGLMRGPLELRRMSQPPDPQNRQNLIFCLRALLGVNARAELMAWLLTHDSGHPASIARATGYFSKSMQQILNEMAESGQVTTMRIGREKHFSILHGATWRALLYPPGEDAPPFPQWADWMPLFSTITHFIETLGKPGFAEGSTDFQAAKLRDALHHCAPALAQAGRAHRMQTTLGLRGSDLVKFLMADLLALLD